MVGGVLLLVDTFEAPMPQTRFVLKKALELNLPVIIVISKVDRPDAQPRVTDETLELLLELDATDEQLDSPIVYASGRTGCATGSRCARGRPAPAVRHHPYPHSAPEGVRMRRCRCSFPPSTITIMWGASA